MTDADQSPTRATHAPGASRLKVAAFLVLMLLAGGALRLWNIESKGPFIWDHAIYWLEGQWYATFAEAVGGSMERFAEERRTGQDLWKAPAEVQRVRAETSGYFPWAGRPVQPMLIGLAMMKLGQKPWVGVLVTAVSGTLLIAAVFSFARRVYGSEAAKFAAALAAFSGYGIVYSIQGWNEALNALAFTPVMWFWYRSLREDNPNPLVSLALAGFFFGLALTVSVRLLPMAIVLPPLELLVWLRRRPLRPWTPLKRAAAFAVPVAIAPAFFELPYHLYDLLYILGRIQPAFPLQTPEPSLPSYWIQAAAMVRYATTEGGLPPGTWKENFWAFPYFLARLDPIVTLVGVAGTVHALRRRTLADGVLVSWFWITFVYLSFNMARTRYLVPAMPALYLLGAGLLRPGGPLAPDGGRGRARAAAALFALIAASGIWLRWEAEPGTRVCYEEAMDFIRERTGTTKHISVAQEVSQVYAGWENVYPRGFPETPPESVEALRGLYEQGYRYYLVDFWRYTSRAWMRNESVTLNHERFARVDATIGAVEADVEPAYVCANPAGAAWPVIHEVEKVFAYAREFPEEERRRSGLIEVYDLKDFFEKRDAAAAPTAPEPEDAPSAP